VSIEIKYLSLQIGGVFKTGLSQKKYLFVALVVDSTKERGCLEETKVSGSSLRHTLFCMHELFEKFEWSKKIVREDRLFHMVFEFESFRYKSGQRYDCAGETWDIGFVRS